MNDLPAILYCNGDYISAFDQFESALKSLQTLPPAEADALRYELLALVRDNILSRWLQERDNPLWQQFDQLSQEQLTDSELLERIFEICYAGQQCKTAPRFENYVEILPSFTLRVGGSEHTVRLTDPLPYADGTEAVMEFTFKVRKSANDRIMLALKGYSADEDRLVPLYADALDLRNMGAAAALSFQIKDYAGYTRYVLCAADREVLRLDREVFRPLRSVEQIYELIHRCSKYASSPKPSSMARFAFIVNKMSLTQLKLDVGRFVSLMKSDYNITLQSSAFNGLTTISSLVKNVCDRVPGIKPMELA